ncbi:MAG TPA: DUF881 domain-containing protein [Clostridiaceae bacterium]|nr:DUF881 domain-containing protein [Clostridiaceae bacterium]
MGNSDRKFILLLAFIILGILVAVQFRSTVFANKKKSSDYHDIQALTESIKKATEIGEELRNEIDDYLSRNENLIRDYIKDQNDNELRREWDGVMLKAGLTDVKGKGVIIQLDDAKYREIEEKSWLLVHDQDVKIILNDLKKAGAQAISINGERITPVSEQVCAGPTILVNQNRYSVPYIINAIGDPDVLYESLINSERVILLKEYGIKVEIKKSDEVVVPKFKGKPENYITGLEVAGNEKK